MEERDRLRNLLARWAELEPSTCELVATHDATKEYEVGPNCMRVHDVNTHWTRAQLMASLAGKAYSRGCRVSTTYDPDSKTWETHVGYTRDGNEWTGKRAKSVYPETALLDAFLHALENE